MQLVYRVVMQWSVTLKLYIARYIKSFTPTLHVQLGTRLDCNPKVAGSSTVRHYLPSNNVRL